MEIVKEHPAKFSSGVLMKIAPHLPSSPGSVILDPFAGVGGVFDLYRMGFKGRIVGIEIEPEWAANHPDMMVGNALDILFPDNYFDAIVTSPVYGNRMSDHHKATDSSKRNTYTHVLGRELHPDNSGKMQWGPAYRNFHAKAWDEAVRVLKPGGLFFLVIKDHIRKGERQNVCLWHQSHLMSLGLVSKACDKILTTGNGYGNNGKDRIPYELIYKFEKAHNNVHGSHGKAGSLATAT